MLEKPLTYSKIVLRTMHGIKKCSRCQRDIYPPPPVKKRDVGKNFLGRVLDVGHRNRTFMCSDCVGFMASRYSFLIFPRLTKEELHAKLKYDKEILMKAYPITLIEQETPKVSGSS